MHNYAIIEKKEAPTRSTFMLSFFEQMLFFLVSFRQDLVFSVV